MSDYSSQEENIPAEEDNQGGFTMKLLINIIAIIIVAVVIGFQFNRTKNLYNKKYDENKDEFKKDQDQ